MTTKRGRKRPTRVLTMPTPQAVAQAAATIGQVAVATVAPEPVLYADDVVDLFRGKVARATIIRRFLPGKAKYAGKHKYWLARDVHEAIASGTTGLGRSA